MSETIRIKDDTAYAINKLGGTLDNPNDVVQQLIIEAGHAELLEEPRSQEEIESDTDEYSHERYIAELLDAEELLTTFKAEGYGAQSVIMAKVTNYLIRHHNLMHKITAPYVSRGTKPLINDSDSQMVNSKQLENGHYIDTNHNSQQKRKRLEDLAFTECGLSIEFSGDW